MERKMGEKQIFDKLKEISEAPSAYLRNWKMRTGKKILGYFCINTPEEIIQAAGVLPVRILSSKESISRATVVL